MRYFDRDGGVLDLWHLPFQWIDMVWQMAAGVSREAEAECADGAALFHRLVGQTGEEYGTQLARFAEDAARRWHVIQNCSFHPCYVAPS